MKGFLRNTIIASVIVSNLMVGGYNFYGLATLVQPVTRSREIVDRRNILRESLAYLQCPRHQILSVEHGIKIATDRTGIGGILIASLLYTESRFQLEAISSKKYKGIAQTPTATMKYAEVDILHGALILQDKLRITNGNIFRALSLYKGGDNPVARKQAKEVLQVYNKVVKAVG